MRFRNIALWCSLASLTLSGLVVAGLARPAIAAFPGRNGKIAFARHGEIYTIAPDGSGLTLLTDPSGDWQNADPTWSPDGTKIAFEHWIDMHSEIYSMNSDGSDLTQLTSGPNDWNPTWSPDGTKIAFRRNPPCTCIRGTTSTPAGIYSMNADGSDPVRLIGGLSFHPAWSPDGTRILFERHSANGRHSEIYTMNPDGSAATRLTNDHRDYISPSWSPNGKQIAFVDVGFLGMAAADHVLTMRADGSHIRLFTSNFEGEGPAWSPDGRKMVFSGNAFGGPYRLYVVVGGVAPDQPGPPPVPHTAGAQHPDWQPLSGSIT